MTMHQFANMRLIGDRRGNTLFLFGAALPLLMAVGALAIDTATLYVGKRRLQGAADAAAMAAIGQSRDGNRAAIDALTANGSSSAELVQLQWGTYRADKTVPIAARFSPQSDSASANAARVTVEHKADGIFARLFGGPYATPIRASAMATKVDVAAFSLGSRLLGVDGGLPNAILSGLAGTQLGLSVADYNALVSCRIDVLRFAAALRGGNGGTLADALAIRPSMARVAEAMASVADDPAAAAILYALAGKLPSTPVALDELIDLGPLGASSPDPDKPMAVDAYALVRAMLEMGGQHQLTLDVGASVPGVASATILVQLGSRPAHSPWLAIDDARKVTVRTLPSRIVVDVTLSVQPTLGLASVHVPIYADLASATATLDSVDCSSGQSAATARLDVVPSLGQVAIGDVDHRQLADFSQPLAVSPATLATVAGARITGRALANLSSNEPQSVDFSALDIQNHVAHTVDARDLVQSIAASLMNNLTLQASAAGLGITIGADKLVGPVAQLLSQAAPAIDQVLERAEALAGVHLGQADSWIDGVRCGTPVIAG